MLYGSLNFLTYFLPICIYFFVLINVFGYRFRTEKHRKIFIATFSAVSVAELACSFLIKDHDVSDLFFEISLMVAASFLPVFYLDIQKKFHLIVFGLMYCTTIDYLCVFISSAFSRDSVYGQKMIYLAICLLIFAAALILSKKSTINHSKLFPVESVSPMLYIVMMVSELSMYYDISFAEESELYKSISFGLKIISGTVLVFGFSYFAVRISKLLYQQRETDGILRAELRHYEDIVEKNELLRKFRHDYQNNLFSLSCLINTEKYGEAKEYINKMSDKLSESKLSFTTGNYLADAILSNKNDLASKSDITIEFDGKIPENGIDNLDLCTVLSNVLDNAVRGCADCAPCVINVSAYTNQSSLAIRVCNPVKADVRIVNNAIKTTKSDKENHGIGLNNIKSIAKKYNGNVSIKCENKMFSIEIGLILN